MQLYIGLQKPLQRIALLVLSAVVLVGCTTSQAVYDDDGIYSNTSSTPVNTTTAPVVKETQPSGVSPSGIAYENYFEEKAKAYEQIPEEGAVFTDIESYTSTEGDLVDEEYAVDYSEGTGYRAGNAAWGDEVSDITVNVYGNNWGGFGVGPWGWGWGYNRWGWGANRWGWGGFYGGWGFYDPFYGPFVGNWGWGGYGWNPYWYNRPFNRPFYNHGHYGRFDNGRIAYANGRRNSAANAIAGSRSRLRESGRRTANRQRAVYTRGRGTARPTNRGIARPRGSATPNRGGRPANASRPANGTRPSVTRPRGTRPNASRPAPSRPRGTARPSGRPNSRPSYSRPSSSSRPSYSRPSSSSRGSGMRSSGGRSGGRSGGGSRGGGRRG